MHEKLPPRSLVCRYESALPGGANFGISTRRVN
jgi:hypothetical protein